MSCPSEMNAGGMELSEKTRSLVGLESVDEDCVPIECSFQL
jgi:hypothetical protein